ncbi:unnamed protein product [Adineta steineri]|uniref:Globin-sensor domain-containing protein n=1 Tax=Adineta steineri TaxID=433720 RepID=A0A819CJW1_9BILA|nr:unnamed protein product [Adineta steineri]CAF1442932.1 unnamed protein product [Adineta steineri]CAF3820078.1 unnamed protein product [Adineta steineri]CAF3920893.1 unnamed protein product [Adineta steineri]
MAEHIDNNKLNDDVRYRFDYFSKFINFTSEDIIALNTLASSVLPLIPVIVDSVYRKLFQYDVTKEYFIVNNDKYDGTLTNNENISLESTQMIFRKDMLSGYLKRLLLQREWTNEFLEYLSRIGRMHTNQLGSSSINVEYLHINTTLTYIENLFIENVCSNDNFDNLTKKNILLALNKVFRIQSDLFIMHFLQPSADHLSTQTIKHRYQKCTCS